MNFVTYFDHKYLPQGMTLINSLKINCPDAKIFVFALDEITYKTLSTLDKNTIVVFNLDDLLNDELKEARSNRTNREFIWTLTPFCISKILKLDYINEIIYIDADMFFVKRPNKIINFLKKNKGKIILTPHYFDAKKKKNEKKHGYYCVQFMNFSANIHNEVLNYWKSRVLEKCSEVPTNGFFGDQKYIEEIKVLFSDLVIDYPDDSSFGAPWNMNKLQSERIEIFHLHGFNYIGNKRFRLFNHSYKCESKKVLNIYNDYINHYMANLNILSTKNKIEDQAFYTKRNIKTKIIDVFFKKNIGVFS